MEMFTLLQARSYMGDSRKTFAKEMQVHENTLRNYELGFRKCPPIFVARVIKYTGIKSENLIIEVKK